MLSPIEGGRFRVTSIIGYRTHPITGAKLSPHHGLDIVGMSSKNIVAVKPGRIVTATQIFGDPGGTWQWGKYIKVLSEDGIAVFYCHQSELIGKVGQVVKAGDIIGVEGTTGQSTGSHLHIEARRGSRKSMIPADPFDDCNIAAILGIPNAVALINIPPAAIPDKSDHAAMVTAKAGLTAAEVAYINRYKYRALVWECLWDAMKNYPKRTSGSYGRDYATAVARACDFEGQTVKYIWGYPGAADLWRKLWWQMT